MIELLVLMAIAYAGARGVEKAAGISDRRNDTTKATKTVKDVAASGGKDSGPAAKSKPGPTEPGGTFSKAAPRSAKIGGKAAVPLAIVTETGSTWWKATVEGYRQRWPEIREEHRRKMAERVQERARKKDETQAQKKAEQATAEAQRKADKAAAAAGPPPPYPPKPTKPPTVGPATDIADVDADTDGPVADNTDGDGAGGAGGDVDTKTDPDSAAGGRRHLAVVPDPELNGDLMSSPSSVIPEIRTLDGLLNALTLVRAMCEMRAEEAAAVAADDLALSNRLDEIEAEMEELEVDAGTRAEIDALRESIRTQTESATQYGAAAKDSGDFATAAAQAARKAHGGIAEAVQSSPIEQAAQAGYYDR